MDIDFYFRGHYLNVNKMDYSLLKHKVTEVTNIKLSPFVWQSNTVKLAWAKMTPLLCWANQCAYHHGLCIHITESMLREKFTFFRDKFSFPFTYKYIDWNGNTFMHTTYTKAKDHYVRYRNTKLMDKYFDPSKYKRVRFSNLRITIWDVRHVVDTLTRLADEGITIYSHPKFSR